MLAIIKQFVRRMLMGKGAGIPKIPPQKAVDDFANDLFKKFKENGVPDEAITNPKDVRIVWEQITNKEAQIMHNNMGDLLKEMDAPRISKKTADVLDLTGKKIDTSKPISGGKNVPESIDLSLVKQRGPHRGIGAGAQASAESSKRIKQGFSTQAKLNNWSTNKQWAKDFINRQNAEFNSLNRADQKEVLDLFEVQIKKHKPKEPKAYGGRIRYGEGGNGDEGGIVAGLKEKLKSIGKVPGTNKSILGLMKQELDLYRMLWDTEWDEERKKLLLQSFKDTDISSGVQKKYAEMQKFNELYQHELANQPKDLAHGGRIRYGEGGIVTL